MKLSIITIILFCLSLVTFAQVKDISVLAGVSVPMYKSIESDAMVTVNYGQFNHKGLGFRVGLQWITSVADIENTFGIPVAFSYRLGARTSQERLTSGVSGAIDAINDEQIFENASDKARNAAGGFLMNLFSDIEFFVGITPGYVAGVSSTPSKIMWGDSWQYWAETQSEKKNSFSLSIDAGICLNYSIWRFDIKVIPAFHYIPTSNYIYHKTTGSGSQIISESSRPVSWFFTLSGGIAYRFN